MFRELILVSLLLTSSLQQAPPFNPPYYNQDDPRWANIELGFGPQTIGQAGCLMTSITMMTAGEGVLVNNEYPTPPIMNSWLKANNGFVRGDDFVWASIDPLGFNFTGFVWDPLDTINAFDEGYRVILNVLDGGHFVLMMGYDETGYVVMDPYFNRTTYLYQDVVRTGLYQYPANSTSVEL